MKKQNHKKNPKNSRKSSANRDSSANYDSRDSSKISKKITQILRQIFTMRFAKNSAKHILFALFCAGIFSAPIYVNYFAYQYGQFSPYINAILALFAIFVALNIDKKYRFFFGFFVGILWFYWISLSFRFTNVPHLAPLIVLFVSSVYGFVFFILLFFNNKFWRICSLALVGAVPILGFDWLVIEAIFSYSIFRVDKIAFIIILASLALFSMIKNKRRKFLPLFLLIFALDFSYENIEIPRDMRLIYTNINQNVKWRELDKVRYYNFNLIEESIARGDKIIILPETAFPYILSGDSLGFQKLLDLSHHITIITGAQREEGEGIYYNSTYIFEDGKYQFLDKIFLAPFGEYAPIPTVLIDAFSALSGLKYNAGYSAKDGIKNDAQTKYFSFRNAICFEGTTKAAYRDNPKFMVLTSNNAWFRPSLEPILQMTLVKYYARLHKTTVFHAANGSNAMIIMPSVGFKPIINGR